MCCLGSPWQCATLELVSPLNWPSKGTNWEWRIPICSQICHECSVSLDKFFPLTGLFCLHLLQRWPLKTPPALTVTRSVIFEEKLNEICPNAWGYILCCGVTWKGQSFPARDLIVQSMTTVLKLSAVVIKNTDFGARPSFKSLLIHFLPVQS